jgi:uncharacterized damage-inducible protein DinB
MQQMMKWLERGFAYQAPAGEYPAILERLRGTPARVEDRIRYVPAERLTAHTGSAWSPQRHIGHLLDLEGLWKARANELLANVAELTPADMSNAKTDSAPHDQRSIAAIAAEFGVARGELLVTLDAVSPDDVVRCAFHPRLQRPMRLIDLCFFVAEHDDHHLAVATRLLRGTDR